MRAKLFQLAILSASAACAPAAQPARSWDNPVTVVSQLYRDYAWEVVLRDDRSRLTLFDEPREVLARYFDDSLTLLIDRDRICRERTHEVCTINGAPIWDSNDPQAVDLVVVASDSTEVAVSFRRAISTVDSEVVRLAYKMVMTPRGWRVRDIVRHDGGSLVQALNAK